MYVHAYILFANCRIIITPICSVFVPFTAVKNLILISVSLSAAAPRLHRLPSQVREVLEKRGRKAAQRALRELTSNNNNHNHPDTAVNTITSSAAAGGKRRATHHPYDSHGNNARVPRRTPLGGVSENDNTAVSDSSRFAAAGAGLDAASSRNGAAGWRTGCDGGGGGGGAAEEEDDAVWLKEAEALLSRGNQELEL